MAAHLQLIYSRSRTVGGWLIRASSWWDQWSHCGLLTDDGTVIEARAFAGVVETPADEFMDRYSAHTRVRVDVPEPAAAIAWAREQIGCGYDYGAIAGFVLREPLDKPRRWQCVELVETALRMAGRPRFRRPEHRITVAQSYMVR